MDLDLNGETVVGAVAGLGATNWALAEQFNFNLITELLGGSAELGFLAVGAAGVVTLTELFGVTDFLDDDDK